MNKKCPRCGEVKPLTLFYIDKSNKDGHQCYCKKCLNSKMNKYRNTERGFLKKRYHSLKSEQRKSTSGAECFFTLDEFLTAFEKHKSIYGMRSAWGPGPDRLEEHLPITMIQEGNGKIGTRGGCIKGSKRIASNLSIDRLDPTLHYTLQNIIFIRYDENRRKNNSSYSDCKIQMGLHEQRFINMNAI